MISKKGPLAGPFLFPMGRGSYRQRQLCIRIAVGGVHLCLCQKDAPGQVGAAEISVSHICTDKVCHSQIGISQIGGYEQRPS